MSEMVADDQSHYEISLTAGQAFVAFILLLLSLAASFGFGLMIGKGQAEDRLVVRKEPAVVSEASLLTKKPAGRVVELGVADDDFQKPQPQPATDSAAAAPVVVEETATSPGALPPSEPVATPAEQSKPVIETVTPQPPARAAVVSHAETAPPSGPVFAQLMSTGDQKSAEALAAKAIERGFSSSYVERTSTAKGMIYRVRVRFASEADARAAESKLKEFAKDVWITK